ncbi:MAG: CDP-alcohol phosphatidyltransferase family protein [Candidatus Lokiarchaeota archaeon]|nr:CDP-alcohol phosphatidyltransferase family protein [Candidatus Lokiarchaeota archaeon]
MTFDEYYDKWLEDHAYNDSSIVKGWLKISYYTCKHVFLPLKFTPLGIDFLSLAFSLLIVVIFSLFPYLDEIGLLISGFLIIFLMMSIGMMDNLDGIIARLTNKKSPRGSYQDLIFDRINDGIILISPIFSNYTKIGSILFLLFTVFIFENLRSIHISAGIPIFSTLGERHARLIFQIGYIGISTCGFYLVSLGYTSQISIFGKIIHFWPNLDILYICLGLISIIGIVQLTLKIAKTQISPLYLSNNITSISNTKEYKLNELSALHEQTSREEFEEAYKNLISATYLYDYKNIIKRLGYVQGKKLNGIIKNPRILFLIILITDFIFFFILLLKFNLKSLNIIIEALFNVFIIAYFLFFMGKLKKMLYYSAYKRYLSIHNLIFFHFLDLTTEILLLSILSFTIPNNIDQIFVIFCLIVQLCRTVNILNQRRKVIEKKTYLPHVYFNIINLFLLFGIIFALFLQKLFLIGFTLLLLFFLIKNIYKTNSCLK